MVFARSSAMAYNRYLDRDIDAKNPRTVGREIPAGTISARNALIFVILNSLAFILCTYFINSLCFYLSPIALLVILGYSWTKRFTALCHLVLGLGLALAPVGAYLAVTEQFSIIPILYGIAVLCWVSGFDIIYALQDDEFDRSMNLSSIPVRFGRKKALRISEALHFFCALSMTLAIYLTVDNYEEAGVVHWLALGVFTALLIYQHRLVKPTDLSKVNLAFFTTNGIASLVFCLLVILDLFEVV